MNWQSWLRVLFDWLGIPALALLAVILVYRRWYKVFSFFFVYVIAAEVTGLVRLGASKAPSEVYSRIYWASDTLLAAGSFLATYELFFKRLFPAFYRIRFYRLLFPIAAILITVLVVISAFLGGHYTILSTTIHSYEFLRGTLLFFFVALMLFMGRQWDKQEFGIALGFCLDVSTSLILLGMWSHAAARNPIVALWTTTAYNIACLVWLYCFWSAPRVPVTVSSSALPPEALHDARKWEESIKDFIAGDKR